MKSLKATQPTCLVSIGTGKKDLILLHRAESMFWFKDRSGLSIAPFLGEIVTDCENTYDELLLSYLESRRSNHLTKSYIYIYNKMRINLTRVLLLYSCGIRTFGNEGGRLTA